MTVGWHLLQNSSGKHRILNKCIRFQSCAFVLLRSWKHVTSRSIVCSITMTRTLPREGTEYGNFILIATIHLWNQFIENSISSLPLGYDFLTSLISQYWTRCRISIVQFIKFFIIKNKHIGYVELNLFMQNVYILMLSILKSTCFIYDQNVTDVVVFLW